MELLKHSCDQIMTIFEVLLYDPLHSWSISPKKAYMLQQVDGGDLPTSTTSLHHFANGQSQNSTTGAESQKMADTNKIAERILFQLRQKLQGFENGAQLSTKGQVNFLINEAINLHNLSRLYAGWQAYL